METTAASFPLNERIKSIYGRTSFLRGEETEDDEREEGKVGGENRYR